MHAPIFGARNVAKMDSLIVFYQNAGDSDWLIQNIIQ